jgi:ABC-type nitrate/sulfonate/bicarbonate transport system substrate-binding protein
MRPPGWPRSPGRQAAAPGASRSSGLFRAEAASWNAWAVLLLPWLWGAACSAPAPASPPPAVPAKPAAVEAAPPAPSAPSARPTVTPLNPPVAVKVGLTGIAPEVAIYQAVERGYFQDEGLEVEIVPVRGMSEQIGLLATGQLQFGVGGVDPGLFNAAQREIGLKYIAAQAGATEQNPAGAALLVRQELVDSRQYQGLSDLRGLTIAVSAIGTTSQSFVERALAKGGLTVDDVTMVAMAFPDMMAGLTNKAVDAAWEVEPFVAIANRRGIAKSVAWGGEVFPGSIGLVMVISPQFAAEQPEAAGRYFTAYLRGMRDYYRAFVSNENPAGREEIYQVLMKHTAVKDPSLYPLMGWPGADPNGGLDERVLDEMQDYLLQRGTIKEKLDVSHIVDHSFANYALERLGRYPQ